MQAVVLAAGAGTRLRPISLTRSKATVPVCGRTLVERILDGLAAAGVADFVVVVRDEGDDVAAVCRAWAGGRRLRFAVQAARRGMAHALLCAAPLLDGPVVVTACDSLCDDAFVAELLQVHRQAGRAATLALLPVPNREAIARTGIVSLNAAGEVTGIVEKPRPEEAPSNIGSLPLYVFERHLLELLPQVQPSPRGELELQDAIAALIAATGPLTGHQAPRRWQVTDTADLLAINRSFLARGQTRTDPRATCRPPVWIDAGAQLGAAAQLGPEVVVEAGAVIGAGAHLTRCVVLRDGVVPAGATLCDAVVAPGPAETDR